MPHVLNNGANVTVVIDDERHDIPPGESQQSERVLAHPLCELLASEKSPIMEPKGDSPKGEMVQRKGYRLVIDGRIPTDSKKADALKKKLVKESKAAATKAAKDKAKAARATAAAKKKAEAKAEAEAKQPPKPNKERSCLTW